MPTSIFQNLNTAISALLGLNQKTTVPVDTDTYVSTRVLPQRKDRFDFSRTIASGVDSTIGTAVITGSGMTISQGSSNLVIASGTTARSETIIRSLKTWQDALNFKWSMIMSQRIANCNVYLELVDVIGDGLAYSITSATSITVTFPTVNPFIATDIGKSVTLGAFAGTGTFLSGANNAVLASISGLTTTFTVAGFAAGTGTLSMFGLNYQHVLYTSTTATNAAYGTQRNGWPFADATVTINTTTAPGHDAVINVEDDMSTIVDALGASTNGQQYSQRGASHHTMPAGDVPLYWQVRVVNLATAPASTTTITIGYIDMENYVPQQVSLTSVRPQTVAAPLPVQVQSAVALAVTNTVSGATAPAVAGDSVSYTGQPVNAEDMQYNGSSWDRVRNNLAIVAEASAAKTVSVAGATQTNFNGRGCIMTLIFSAQSGTTPTIAAQLQWSPDGGTTWINYGPATFAAAAPVATNTWTLIVYPTQIEDDTTATLAAFTVGSTVSKFLNAPLPRIWRFNYTLTGTSPSFTFAHWVNYLS